MIEKLDFDENKLRVLYSNAITNRVIGLRHEDWEMFALDLICYYYEKIKLSPEKTITTLYDRLCDNVRNDYDNKIDDFRSDYLIFANNDY